MYKDGILHVDTVTLYTTYISIAEHEVYVHIITVIRNFQHYITTIITIRISKNLRPIVPIDSQTGTSEVNSLSS